MLLLPARPIRTVKVFSFRCPACGYESKHQVGTPDMDQILTDVNTEFVQ
jgi:hypothetical protein